MKILSITAGAGQMYCGSCLRDNALAAELIARGHDVVLTPVYTPTRTDERNVSQHHVLFGGISVYLEQHSSLFRQTPRFLDRLWDRRVGHQARVEASIAVDPQSLGEMTVSMLQATAASCARNSTSCSTGWRRAACPTSSTCRTRC